MLELHLSPTSVISSKRKGGKFIMTLDEHSNDFNMEVSLISNKETTDRLHLRITEDDGFDVSVESHDELYAELEELNYRKAALAEYEYALLTLQPVTSASPPTFTLQGEDFNIQGIGGDLINILNFIGKDSWVLAYSEKEFTYIMKREKQS